MEIVRKEDITTRKKGVYIEEVGAVLRVAGYLHSLIEKSDTGQIAMKVCDLEDAMHKRIKYDPLRVALYYFGLGLVRHGNIGNDSAIVLCNVDDNTFKLPPYLDKIFNENVQCYVRLEDSKRHYTDDE